MEIEAKLNIPDEATFQRLLEAEGLAGFHLGSSTVADLYDQYLDTASMALLAQGYGCRIRRQGTDYVATIKSMGGASGAIHRRSEHEVALQDPLPPQDWPPGRTRDLVLHLCGNEPLTIILEVTQTRHSRPLYTAEHTVAELSLDRGQIVTGDAHRRAASFLLLEAELSNEGYENDLEKLVRELETVWRLAPERRSKFERGLALLGLKLPATEEQTRS